jgi:hypothetical protein
LNREFTRQKIKIMKKTILVLCSIFIASVASAQADCFKRYEEAFTKRGAYTVSDEMHRNVIISFFEKDGVTCVAGKARVENGQIVSIFIQYDDNTYESFEALGKKFYNEKKAPAIITNGISEMIYTNDNQKLKVIFIDKLKPKQKIPKSVTIPDDL